MRHTLVVRQQAGVEAKLRAKNRRQRAAILDAMARHRERVDQHVLAEMNFDTGYMLSQYRSEATYGGYGHRAGFRSGDFVGQTNDLADPPFVIEEFYPPMVHDGTSTYAGNPFLANAQRRERDNLRRALKRALEA